MSELSANRANTLRFIEADPVVVQFERKQKIESGDGGFKWGDAIPTDPQIMRLIPLSDSMPIIQTPDGFQRTPGFVLLGRWDATMDVWDYFTIGLERFQIVSPIRPLHTINAYERKGDVALV